MKHDTCDHPRTPAGRAACRKGAAKAPQSDAQAPTRVRRTSPRAPRIDAPATLSEVVAFARQRQLPMRTHSPYVPEQGILEVTSPQGVLMCTWLLADPNIIVASFRQTGHPIAYRHASIEEAMAKL